jgi:hypothetical protein
MSEFLDGYPSAGLEPVAGDRGWCKVCGGVLVWTEIDALMSGGWRHLIEFNYGRGSSENHMPELGDVMFDTPTSPSALQITLVYADQILHNGAATMPTGCEGAEALDLLDHWKASLIMSPSWVNLLQVKLAQVRACGSGDDDDLQACLVELMGACFAWIRGGTKTVQGDRVADSGDVLHMLGADGYPLRRGRDNAA